MAANHHIVPTMPLERVTTVRLGVDNTLANRLTDLDAGKFVKLAGDSRYVLTAAGEPIEGAVVQVEPATSNGFSIGGIVDDGKLFATADGLQATPGTGTIAVGDYVVTGTVVAKGTAMPGYPRVCKATSQALIPFAWRCVGLYTAGSGAVNTVIVIARV